MKQKVYLETSVVSYLTARPAKNIIVAGHQAATHDFWSRLSEFDIYISELVMQEAAGGDKSASEARLQALRGIPELEIDSECRTLAEQLIEDGAVPESCPEDALHIAVTAVHGIDAIATWNFKHINNNETRGKIRKSVAIHGYICPEICSPDEFLGEDYE